ncbi:hypothetical protein [Actinoplanes sp. NPDC051851]|uniref:hypothetical protein n=1 Tax=Actinoplanes sp. NPDC051851 TaxID=3154753 RepID=UPI0034431A10
MMVTSDAFREKVRRLAGAASAPTWATAGTVAALNLMLIVGASVGFRTTSVVVVLIALIVVAGVHTGRSARPPASRGHSALNRPEAVRPGSEAFDEDLELVIHVGLGAEGDRVVEHRVTRRRHAHAIGYRKLTLISAYVGSDTEEVSVVPELTVHDQDIKADWLPLDITGRGAVIFMPPVFVPVLRWELGYAVPNGIWNPLREVGIDNLRYDLRTFPIRRFTVRFVIHPRAKAFVVRERNRLGTMRDDEWDANGNLVVCWQAEDPAVQTRYEWDLRAEWQ